MPTLNLSVPQSGITIQVPAASIAIGGFSGPQGNPGTGGGGGGGTWASLTGTPPAITIFSGSLAYSSISGAPTLGTSAAKDIPASGNASPAQVVYGSDTRLSDARTLSGTITKSQISDLGTIGTAAAKNIPASGNAAAGEVVYGTDTRLTDARTLSGSIPESAVTNLTADLAAKATTATALDTFAATTDNTSLNASSSAHGLMPKADGNAGHFYCSDGTQKAVGGSGTTTIARWDFSRAQPPAAAYAYFGARNTGGLGVWQFAGSGSDTSLVFTDIVPQGTTFATGIQAIIFWASTTATTGAVEWQGSIDNVAAHSIDIDSYGTAVSATTTTNGVAAVMNSTTISLPIANMQSLAAEQPYKFKLTRRASDGANDTMADTASLLLVLVRTY